MSRTLNTMLLMLGLGLLGHGSAVLASGLPAEHESVRLMLAVEAAVEGESWERAAQQLGQLQALDVGLPEAYYFYQGLVLFKRDNFPEAQKHLEQYVILAGSKGKHYPAALQLITRIEEALAKPKPAAETEPAAKTASAITSVRGEDYIQSLQKIYLTDNPVQALVMQVNSLLSAHAWSGSRVKKQNDRSGVVYSIEAKERDILVQEKRFENGQVLLKVVKLNVLGIDPFLRSECSIDESVCWIYDPVATHQRWIVIDRDELAVKELTDALSKLIVRLQR